VNKHLLIALNCCIVVALAILFSSRAEAQSGGVDTTFKPGFDGDVFSVRIQPNDKLLVSGFFSKVGNVSRSGVARLNSTAPWTPALTPAQAPLIPFLTNTAWSRRWRSNATGACRGRAVPVVQWSHS